jgi:hypothetical protein
VGLLFSFRADDVPDIPMFVRTIRVSNEEDTNDEEAETHTSESTATATDNHHAEETRTQNRIFGSV